MNWSVWVPTFTALVAIFGGAFAYRSQKRVDQIFDLSKEKRETYREYLASIRIYEFRARRSGFPEAVEPRREAVERYMASYSNLLVFAPEKVLAICLEVNNSFRHYVEAMRDHYERDELTRSEVEKLHNVFEDKLQQLIFAMRSDLGLAGQAAISLGDEEGKPLT